MTKPTTLRRTFGMGMSGVVLYAALGRNAEADMTVMPHEPEPKPGKPEKDDERRPYDEPH